MRRLACLACALLTSCGVASGDGESPNSGAVAICTPSHPTGPKVRPDTPTDFAVWVGRRPDLFAGVWWDSVSGDYVFAATDTEQARAMIQQVFPAGLSYRVDAVPRGASALRALQQRVLNVVTTTGASPSSAFREWDGRIEIELDPLDRTAITGVEREFADELDAVCVTEAVPATTSL